jgi:ubiquinone/menaquinone biosynthesis C-methylase UbiE
MGTIRKLFYKFYEVMRDIIVPGLINSQFAYKEMLKTYINNDTRWLDLGCGQEILPGWMKAEEEVATLVLKSKLLVGIDYKLSSLQKHKTLKYKIRGDIIKLPCKNNLFNLVTANMVVEHLENPTEALSEIYRVLEPGGLFIFHTPNFLNYQILIASITPQWLKNKLIMFFENRKEDDIFPTYYRLNTYKTIRTLSNANGFNLLEIKILNSSQPSTIMLGPVVIGELLVIRLLKMKWFANLRTVIIAVLQKKVS